MRLTTIAAASVAALLLSPLPALASSERRTTTVRHGDLNLADAADRRTLERRVTAAAEYVCAVNYDQGPLAIAMRERRCLRETIAKARPAVDLAVARGGGTQVAVAAAGSW